MKQFLENALNNLPEGLSAQLHSYVPFGAKEAVTVLVLSESKEDLCYASDSISRAAQTDHAKSIAAKLALE